MNLPRQRTGERRRSIPIGRAVRPRDYFRSTATRQFSVDASSEGVGSGFEGDIGFGDEGPELSAGPRTGCQTHISLGSKGSTGFAFFAERYGVLRPLGGLLKSNVTSSISGARY